MAEYGRTAPFSRPVARSWNAAMEPKCSTFSCQQWRALGILFHCSQEEGSVFPLEWVLNAKSMYQWRFLSQKVQNRATKTVLLSGPFWKFVPKLLLEFAFHQTNGMGRAVIKLVNGRICIRINCRGRSCEPPLFSAHFSYHRASKQKKVGPESFLGQNEIKTGISVLGCPRAISRKSLGISDVSIFHGWVDIHPQATLFPDVISIVSSVVHCLPSAGHEHISNLNSLKGPVASKRGELLPSGFMKSPIQRINFIHSMTIGHSTSRPLAEYSVGPPSL